MKLKIIAGNTSEILPMKGALIESKKCFQDFFYKNSLVMLLVEPVSGDIVDANKSASHFYGYPLSRLVGMPIHKINTLSQSLINTERLRALNEQRNYFIFSHRLASGQIRDVEVYSTPILSAGRTLLCSVVLDINSRKLADETLRSSRDFLNNIISHIGEPVFVKNENHQFLHVNDALCNMLGLNRQEIIGKSLQEVFPTEQVNGFWSVDNEVLMTGKTSETEHLLNGYEGKLLNVVIKKSLFVDAHENKFLVGVTHNITERKHAEQALQEKIKELQMSKNLIIEQAQQVLLNRLSIGFGHNFRNILAGIAGALEELSQTVEKHGSIEIVRGSNSAERIEAASKAVARAVSLINMIIDIGQPSKIENFQNLNLNDITQKIKEIASGSVSTFIEIKLDLALDLDMMQGDAEKIQNLLWQLLLNAIQAIDANLNEKQAGSITIQTSNENIENHESLKSGNYVVLRVTDSGSGISAQDSKQIFDLFHSGRLQQPGVGLNVVKIISEQHSAFINIERSVVGEGTTFVVYFPAIKADKSIAAVEKIAEPLSAKTSKRTIFIVEDEEMIQSMYKTLVEKNMGLPSVLQAIDTDQAIAVFKANQEKIGLVILDLGIPGAGGNYVFNEIRKINPKIEVIVNSGYQQSSERARVDEENYIFFQKPVALKVLKTVITERLGLEE